MITQLPEYEVVFIRQIELVLASGTIYRRTLEPEDTFEYVDPYVHVLIRLENDAMEEVHILRTSIELTSMITTPIKRQKKQAPGPRLPDPTPEEQELTEAVTEITRPKRLRKKS